MALTVMCSENTGLSCPISSSKVSIAAISTEEEKKTKDETVGPLYLELLNDVGLTKV